MIKAVFFDLDGTLLPLDEDVFIKLYFKLMSEKMCEYGFKPNELINNIWNGTKLINQSRTLVYFYASKAFLFF